MLGLVRLGPARARIIEVMVVSFVLFAHFLVTVALVLQDAPEFRRVARLVPDVVNEACEVVAQQQKVLVC